MKNYGFVIEPRSILECEWYTKPNVMHLYRHCRLMANFAPKLWQGIEIKPGQFVTSLQKLADSTGLSISQIRTALKKLEVTNKIASKTTNKYRIITVIGFETEQSIDKQNDNQITIKSQSNRKQIATTNKDNKDNKDNNEGGARTPHGTFGNVMLTESELADLRKRYPKSCEKKINRFSRYLNSNPSRKYENHYAKLLEWLIEDVGETEHVNAAAYDIDELDKINLLENVI